MKGARGLLVVAAAAAAGGGVTVLAGAGAGMHGHELGHLALLLLPAALATVAAAAAAQSLFARISLRSRLTAIAVVALLVGLANLAVVARLMFVSGPDMRAVVVVLAYAVGAGAGAALVLARGPARAVGRLSAAARALAEGDLSARAGDVGGGPEYDALASTLDQMAERLGQAMARVQDVEARRRDLITAVSHDLRTPLARLRVMVEAIDEGVVDDVPTLRRYAGEMRRSVDTLVALVDDLFELVQLDAGAIEAETARTRVRDVVSSAIGTCKGDALSKGVSVRTDLDGAGDAACSLRLVRVLQNLVQNSIRHTPPDGTVTIQARRLGGRLRLVVEDTGEGIPPDALTRVFDPFYRADPARSEPGSGLGLAVAKRIVQALGGDITAGSEPPMGARFAVTLPDSPDLRPAG
ncbi:MAG: HAMP domain-containing histidine kinase [Actinomycetota bacterium]|nr:HAMP domain-containing histidine kinase [Actinomycetota bacterium]